MHYDKNDNDEVNEKTNRADKWKMKHKKDKSFSRKYESDDESYE